MGKLYRYSVRAIELAAICAAAVFAVWQQGSCAEGYFTSPAGWSMSALPVSPDGGEAVCPQLGQQVFAVDGGVYVPCDAAHPPVPGRGYLTYRDVAGDVSVQGTPANAARVFKVQLQKGWNLVGNPFFQTVLPVNITVDGGGPYYNSSIVAHDIYTLGASPGQYTKALSMLPYNAYFVYAEKPCTLGISICGSSCEPDVPPGQDPSLFAPAFGPSTVVAQTPGGPRYVADQAIVVMQPGTTSAAASALISSTGGQLAGANASAGLFLATVPAGMTPDEYIAALAGQPGVFSGSPNYVADAADAPNDPPYSAAVESDGRWGFDRTKFVSIWKQFTPAARPVIAVVDTGVASTHPDLAGRVVPGWNFIDPASPWQTNDDNGHGTAIAGIAAAQGDNGTGIAGACWHCSVMPVKACDASGSCPLFAVMNGITYAAKNGANVINLSLGAEFQAGASAAEAVNAVLSDAAMRGIFIVAAAGNSGGDAANFLPGGNVYALSAGAVSRAGGRFASSNFGPSVGIAAPGESILSDALGGGTAYVSGTSAASAFVSGAAGLALSLNPGMSPNTLRRMIASSAGPVSSDQPIGGLLDAAKLVQLLSGGNAAPATPVLSADAQWVVTKNTLRIVAQSSDPEGRPLSYIWSADSGTLAASGAVAVWTAPSVRGKAVITVRAVDTYYAQSGAASMTIAVLEGGLSGLYIEPGTLYVQPGGGLKMRAYAVDSAAQTGRYAAIPVDAEWSVSSGIAVAGADGSLAGLSEGQATVTAAFAGLKVEAALIVSSVPAAGAMGVAADTDACVADWSKYRCNNAGSSQYDGASGKPYFERWQYGMPTFVHAGMVSRDGKLYVVDNAGNVAKLDIAAGTADWTDSQGVTLYEDAAPIVLGNYLYVPDSRGRIIRYDLVAGPAGKTTIYTATVQSPLTALAALAGETSGGVNTIYFGMDRMYAITDSGGASATLKWMFPPAGSAGFTFTLKSAPIAVTIGGQKVVVFGGTDQKLYVLNANTGANLGWSPVTIGSDLYVGAVYSDNFGGRLYIGDLGGKMKAIDTTTGSVAWTRQTPGGIYGAPAVVGDMLYYGDADGKIQAVRDLGATYDDTVWAAAPDIGTLVRSPVVVTSNEIIAAPYRDGTLSVIDPVDGSVDWVYSGTIQSAFFAGVIAVKRHPTKNDMEIYAAFDNGTIAALEKNYPPAITAFSTTSPAPPSGLVPAASAPPYATIYAKVSDTNGLSDLVATMSLDLSSLGGSAAETLYDDHTHGDPVSGDGEYYNNAAAWVRLGTPAGQYTLYATATDKSGLTGSSSYGFIAGEATPSIVSASFSPAYVQKGGVATTTITAVVQDYNASISSVQLDLDAINGAAGTQWTALTCGAFSTATYQATCTASGITAASGTAASPPDALLTLRASDTSYAITSPVSLEVLGIASFTATATRPIVAGLSSQFTLTAYDKYGALFTAYNNTNPIQLSASGYATATSVTWSGAGVTNNAGTASGTLAAGYFVNGVASVFVQDTKATETLTLTAAEQDTGSSVSGSASSTWVPGTLAKIAIRIAPNNGGYEVGSYSMDPGQTLPLYCAGYDTYSNYIAEQSCTWNVSGTLTPAPATGQYSNFNFAPLTSGVNGVISATSSNGLFTDLTGFVQVSGLRPSQTTPSAVNASGTAALTWTAVTTYTDTTALDPATVKYEVYRSTTFGGSAADPFTLMTTTASGELSWTDTAVAMFVKYYYVIVAVDSKGLKSRQSSMASVLITPPPFVYKQTCGDQTTGNFQPNTTPGFMNRPAAVTADGADNLYVADMYNNRIQKFDKNCVYQWTAGKYGTTAGTFKLPVGIVYNPVNSKVYVADYNNRVQIFDTSGAYQSSFSVAGPNSLAVDTAGNVYVTTTGGQLVKTSADGATLMTVTGLSAPRGVVVASDGSIFVVENGTGKITKLSAAGARTGVEFAGAGTVYGKLNSANGLCMDAGGNLYVSDTYNDRIQEFSPDGAILNVIGTSGQNYGQLRRPTGAWINSAGNLVAADNYNNRLQEFTKP